MVALCYGGSNSGTDRGDIELLRDDIIMAYNTVNVLTTDHDLDLWFNNFAKRYNTKAHFFKRRDDPSGRLFSQFIAITDNSYVYPTNTLTILVNNDQFDFINENKEFIIKPGHLWEYADDDITYNGQTFLIRPRDKVRMVKDDSTGVPLFVNDDVIPNKPLPGSPGDFSDRGSHRSVLAGITAHGSSGFRFATCFLFILSSFENAMNNLWNG
jgi:hypothetical protein